MGQIKNAYYVFRHALDREENEFDQGSQDCGLIVGADPVAVDESAKRIIEANRLKEFGEDPPINPSPKLIMVSDTKYKPGNYDPAKIELIRLGWREESLI